KHGQMFDSIDDAAKDFAKTYNDDSIKNNREYGSTLYQKQIITGYTSENAPVIENKYYYSKPIAGASMFTAFEDNKTNGDAKVGLAHTHAAYDKNLETGNDNFSSDDRRISDYNKVPIYAATPSGDLLKYDKASNFNAPIAGVSDGISTDPGHDKYSNMNQKPTLNYNKDESRSGTIKEYYDTHIKTK
ncbi:MAG TPA: DUF4329 domain-containing protein, partial [Spirochaetota bacterium]|nr:DUF4329 domain-containing protein [Spirochaetota bacterium]